MIPLLLPIALGLLAQPNPPVNPIQQALIERGVRVGDTSVPLPQPSFADGLDGVSSRAILRTIVGDEQGVANFLRDSVTAPFVLRTRDVKAQGATIRVADLWFAVRGRLEDVDLKQVIGKTQESVVEAGNMRFATKVLDAQEVADCQLDRPIVMPGRDEWYTRTQARLLDRIALEVIDHAIATRSTDSITIASATTPMAPGASRHTNYWATVRPSSAGDLIGPRQDYGGGGSYAKITRFAAEPDVLIVEGHFAFVEPDPWFDGNPILRSKLALVCQDQIRRLRREIQKQRSKQ